MGKRLQRSQHSLELGNLRIPLPSLLLYLLGVSLLCFVPLDHFGSRLSDKPSCSEVTRLR